MKLDSLLLCVAIQSATEAGAKAPETSSDGSKAISFLFLIPNAASAAIATLLLLLSLLLSYQGSQTPPNGFLLLRSNDEELWSPGQTARLNGCDIYVQGCSHRSYWRGLHPSPFMTSLPWLKWLKKGCCCINLQSLFLLYSILAYILLMTSQRQELGSRFTAVSYSSSSSFFFFVPVLIDSSLHSWDHHLVSASAIQQDEHVAPWTIICCCCGSYLIFDDVQRHHTTKQSVDNGRQCLARGA